MSEVDMLLFQKGLNYSQDGRGNRMVYHLVGCNMRCPWCANPEGIKAGGTILTKGGIPRRSWREYSVDQLISEAVSLKDMFLTVVESPSQVASLRCGQMRRSLC